MRSLTHTNKFVNMLRKKLKLNPIEENSVKLSTSTSSKTFSDQVLDVELELNVALKNLQFVKPVAYVYSPLDYAIKPHFTYMQKYCKGPKKVLFVGMNPGPWGMCQTGVPFGEVNIVKEWFGIDEEVSKPIKECPERLIQGFACKRSEVSGKRLWGLIREISINPEVFFENSFMYNYCPIAMLEANGKNVTPAEIKGSALEQLESACDSTLKKIIELLQVETLIAIGKYVEKRANKVLKEDNPLNTKVLYLVHPSPRVKGDWTTTAQKTLTDLNLIRYMKSS